MEQVLGAFLEVPVVPQEWMVVVASQGALVEPLGPLVVVEILEVLQELLKS